MWKTCVETCTKPLCLEVTKYPSNFTRRVIFQTNAAAQKCNWSSKYLLNEIFLLSLLLMFCCLGPVVYHQGPAGHEWAWQAEGAGRSHSRGWECAVCSREAECPPQREGPLTTVWRSAMEWPPSPAPSVFYSPITKKIGKQAVTEHPSTYRSVCCGVWEGGVLRVSKCDNNW